MHVSFLPVWILYLVLVPWARLVRMISRSVVHDAHRPTPADYRVAAAEAG
jgi:hypothetical protein